ncbi:hypothetical protein MASR2M39_12220 [Ignavibacteriales bacterium]
MTVDGEDIRKCMESLFALHSQLMNSGLTLSMKQAELIYNLTSSKVKSENNPRNYIDEYLNALEHIEGSSLKKPRIIDLLNKISSATSSNLEKEMIQEFLISIEYSSENRSEDNLKNRFNLDIEWKDIEQLFISLEKTPGNLNYLRDVLKTFEHEYFLDYLGNDVLQDKIFFDEEVHIRYSNRASEYQNGRIVEVLQRGIREQGTCRVIRKATVVTSFRA